LQESRGGSALGVLRAKGVGLVTKGLRGSCGTLLYWLEWGGEMAYHVRRGLVVGRVSGMELSLV